jgi:hypothetical protein
MRLKSIIACLVILVPLPSAAGTSRSATSTPTPLVAAQVEALTGRPVTIAGDIKLSPSLHPSS